MVDVLSDPKSDPNSNQKVDNYTTNGKNPQKLLKNRFVPNIIQGAICPIDPLVKEDVPGIRETLGALQTVLTKEIVTNAAHSGARILQTPREVSQTYRDGFTSW